MTTRFIRATRGALARAAFATSLGCSGLGSESSSGGRPGLGQPQGGSGNNGGRGSGGSSFGGTSGGSFGGTSGGSFGGTSGGSFGGTSGSSAGGASGSSFGGAGGSAAGGSGGGAGALGTGGAATGGSAGAVGSSGTGDGGGGLFGGYMIFGNWHGYAWTYASGTGSRIDPPNFANRTSPPLCASGVVGAGTTNVAMLGVNLNQATAAGSPALAVVPTMAGVTVNVTNNTSAPLRIQLQGPNGDTDENQRWCAPIFGSGGFIPWNAFNTRCWDGSGTAYNRQPIVAAMILVPGSTGPVSFDFCLNGLTESNDPNSGGGGGGGGCTITGPSGEGTGTITGQYDWKGVTRNSRNYVVQNNVWGGSASQALSYTGVSFQVTQQTGNNPTSGAPVSYPSVFIGSNNGRSTAGSNLPKRVSTLTTVQTGWSWSSNGAGGTYNAAYDVWFSTGAGGDAGNPSGGYLMVWLHKPTNAQPIGTNQGVLSIAGGTFNVWIGTQLGRPIISYTRTPSTNSMSFDLNLFIADAVARGTLRSDWYLSNIFAGFEIWSGGVNLRTDNFCAVVN